MAGKSPSPLRQLRYQLRKHRRTLTSSQQRVASASVTRLLYTQLFFLKAKKIGFYWPTDGELDITALISDQQRNWYLPLISESLRPWEDRRLLFQALTPLTQIVKNRYDIVEPAYDPAALINPAMLDVVLLPLVGFDRSGNRLGMGKAYYDRTFQKNNWHHPKLVGVAHSIQECESLIAQLWDVPLMAIVTEKEFIWSAPQRERFSITPEPDQGRLTPPQDPG